MYSILKDKNQKLQKESDLFNAIFEDAKKMRALLEGYYKSGKMNNTTLQELNLDKPHPILSDPDASNED